MSPSKSAIAKPAPNSPWSFGTDGLSTVESERLTTLAGRQRKLISHLENALIRIKNKVYGVCRESGVLISKERLMAVPHATLSIAAKQTKNK